MVTVHMRLGAALVVVAAAGTLWAFVGALRGNVSPALRAFTRMAAIAVLVQVLLGLLLLTTGHRPSDSLHFVYGGVAGLCIPAGIAYAGGLDVRREAWSTCFGLLAAVLIVARAVMTGG